MEESEVCLALAHRFEKLIRDGVVRDYADLARLGHVTRSRVSQIMDLWLLAAEMEWGRQRNVWQMQVNS